MDPRRAIPRTDDLLRLPEAAAACDRVGLSRVKETVTQVQVAARSGALDPETVAAQVAVALASLTSPPATQLREILNATGVVLHTNAGRASLSAAAREAVQVAAAYVDVEVDLETGRRGRRGRATLAALAALVPQAQDVLVVNNGAAALMLATTALAAGREILVSRGEMVEIGDGFRLPDLIESTGVRIREVGTTNRTRLADYADAIGPQTAAVLKVHPSNFRIEGFTQDVSVEELAGLGLRLIVDVGSGLLQPHPLLPDEPDVATALSAGATVVTASGDKLFGGPQAGLVLGSADAVAQLRRHPLARAVRSDKLTLAALEATAAQDHRPVTGPQRTSPTWAALLTTPAKLKERAECLTSALRAKDVACEVVSCDGAVGGGGAPGVQLRSWAVALPQDLAVRLRTGRPAVLARIDHGSTLVDLRCIPPERDRELARAIVTATIK